MAGFCANYAKGDDVDYRSTSQMRWLPAVIEAVNGYGHGTVLVKVHSMKTPIVMYVADQNLRHKLLHKKDGADSLPFHNNRPEKTRLEKPQQKELDHEKAKNVALEEKNAELRKKSVAACLKSAVAQSKEKGKHEAALQQTQQEQQDMAEALRKEKQQRLEQEAASQQKQQELEEELRKEKQQKLEQEAALQQKQQELVEELRKQQQKLDQVEECKAKAMKASDDLAKQVQKMQQASSAKGRNCETDSAMPASFRVSNFKEVSAQFKQLRQQQAAGSPELPTQQSPQSAPEPQSQRQLQLPPPPAQTILIPQKTQ